ncbi:sel1 repeat family protein [Streptomyces sp. 021-4]|uniref:sel1 repeat family protein n=1 Tax=Streptomyces sp. 021-4 TaxID=2789260 RepID=UPI0039F4B813
MDAELEPLTDALMRIMTGDDWGRLIDDASFYNVSPLVQLRTRLLVRSRESPQLAREGLLSALRTTRNDAPDLLAEIVRLVGALHGGIPASRDGLVDNAVSGGTFHAPVIQASTVNGGQHTYYGQPPYSSLPPITAWPRLNAADPIALGVRLARRLPGESPLPHYVERDCDPELSHRVLEAAGAGGLVLVTGAPLSGRTRTAWGALTGNLPGTTRVFAPSAGTDLRGLPALLRKRAAGGCVLWLDNLEGHLGEHGLTPAVLASLVHFVVPVIATMDDEAYEARRFGTADRARVLDGIRAVELNRVWSDSELQRLEAQDEDARLRSARLWCGPHTVPEYLAVGPDLVEEWRRASRRDRHPRGHLLVRAAVDLIRCGVPDGGISSEVLREAQKFYPDEFALAEVESFDDGLAWAAKQRDGVSGLLVPGDKEGTWSVFGALLADAIDRPDDLPVPLDLWTFALGTVRTKGARWTVRSNAHVYLVDRAEDDPMAAAALGDINVIVGDLETAELWCRRAADAGHTEAAATAGALLAARDAEAEAIPYLEQAAEAGIVRSQYLLGMLLANQAQSWLARAAEAGHPAAADALPPLRKVTDTPPDTVKA